MKSYTDIEQSRKLAEILPLESADMHYSKDFDGNWFVDLAKYTSVKIPKYVGKVEEHLLPCWSLAALKYLIWNTSIDAVSCPHIYNDRIANGYYVLYGNYETNTYSSIVDSCYETVLKLHESNLL